MNARSQKPQKCDEKRRVACACIFLHDPACYSCCYVQTRVPAYSRRNVVANYILAQGSQFVWGLLCQLVVEWKAVVVPFLSFLDQTERLVRLRKETQLAKS